MSIGVGIFKRAPMLYPLNLFYSYRGKSLKARNWLLLNCGLFCRLNKAALSVGCSHRLLGYDFPSKKIETITLTIVPCASGCNNIVMTQHTQGDGFAFAGRPQIFSN